MSAPEVEYWRYECILTDVDLSRAAQKQVSRRRVGHALLDLAGKEGLAGASVRGVAAAAGCSPGAVQKYFTTSDEMLEFALDLAGERTAERLASVDTHGAVRDVVRGWIVATLPLDEERRAEARVWAEFAARAAGHPPFADTLALTDREVRAALAGVLDAARARGELAADLPVAAAAHALVAVSDGLAVQLLYDGADPDAVRAALAALDGALAALLRVPDAGRGRA